MPRTPKIEFVGAFYHVMARGVSPVAFKKAHCYHLIRAPDEKSKLVK